MKRIMRCFELASGLKVNMQKSILVGVNCLAEVLRPSANILHCKVGCLPIQYLWLHVGANQRLKEVWDSVRDKVKKKLRWIIL